MKNSIGSFSFSLILMMLISFIKIQLLRHLVIFFKWYKKIISNPEIMLDDLLIVILKIVFFYFNHYPFRWTKHVNMMICHHFQWQQTLFELSLIELSTWVVSRGVARILILEGPEPTKSFHNRQNSWIFTKIG